MLTYLLLFAVFLFLPGWLLCRVVAPRRVDYLACFAASLLLLMANIGLFVHLRLPFAAFTAVVAAQVLILTVGSWRLAGPPLSVPQAGAALRRNTHWLVGAALTAGSALAYLAWAGVYTEVPADVWRHLGYTQWALEAQEGDRPHLPWHLWYYIPAWFRRLSGDGALGFVHGFGAANTLIQALGLYAFSFCIARRLAAGTARAACLAYVSVLFAAFSIGVDVFSYLRYYTFGPMFHNMLVYFCAVLLVVEIFETRRARPAVLAALAVLAATLYWVHDQELAFLYALVLALAGVTLLQYLPGAWRLAGGPRSVRDAHRADLYAAIAVLGGTLALFLCSRYNLPVQGKLDPWIVPLASLLPFGEHLYIANPSYQVYQSLTIWGLLVYVLFGLYWRELARSRYLLAGMLLPLVTVFNPLFIDMFIRYSDPSPVYRFIYAVPLHIVAAWCLMRCAEALRGAALAGKAGAALAAAALLALLFPIAPGYLHNSYSRAYTLEPVPAGNDYGQWQDMINYLRARAPTRIITDPVSSYLLRGTTHHRARGYKFHQVSIPLDRDAGYYARFTGALIVLNRRDGAISGNGRRARHWPADVLRVSRYYPPTLEHALRGAPGRFEPLWERDRVAVFRVAGPGER